MLLLGKNQRETAEYLGVSQNTLESWLADEKKTWARTPNHLEQAGILVILKRAIGGKRNGPKNRKIDSDEAVRMFRDGHSVRQIATHFDVTPAAIYLEFRRPENSAAVDQIRQSRKKNA